MILQSVSDILMLIIMMLYISAMDHARKLKFRCYVHLPSINIMFPDRYACVILCNIEEVIIFEHGCYISAFAHIRMLILRICVLLEYINTVYKYGHACVI